MGKPKKYEVITVSTQTKGDTKGYSKDADIAENGSQIDNPIKKLNTALDTSKAGIDSSDDRALRREGNEIQTDTQRYVQGNEDYGMTPETAFDRYNTTGVGTRNRRKLSRLVDALNARDWGTTKAAGQFDNSGMSHSNAGWSVLPVKDVETAESRAQRRVEDYEAQSAQAAIARDDMLRRMAPELWRLKETLTTQFASNLDNTQVNAINGAIQLLFNESQMEFSNRENLRNMLQISKYAATLPSDTQRIFFNTLASLPQMNQMTMQLTDSMQEVYDYYMKHGGLDKEHSDMLNFGMSLGNQPAMMQMLYSMGALKQLPGNVLSMFHMN